MPPVPKLFVFMPPVPKDTLWPSWHRWCLTSTSPVLTAAHSRPVPAGVLTAWQGTGSKHPKGADAARITLFLFGETVLAELVEANWVHPVLLRLVEEGHPRTIEFVDMVQFQALSRNTKIVELQVNTTFRENDDKKWTQARGSHWLWA